MTTVTAEKPAFQDFLEKVKSILGYELYRAPYYQLKMLTIAYHQGLAPTEAATEFLAKLTQISQMDFGPFIAEAKEALRNHAASVEQRVQALSNQISHSVQANGAVDGLLYFSHDAHELPRLGAQLTVYREFLATLGILDEVVGSERAVDMARDEAVSRLVNMKEGGESGERAGAAEALKKVIKILDYCV